MNLNDDEVAAVEKESSKREIDDVEPKLPIAGTGFSKLPVTHSSFVAANFLSLDKFGAVLGPEDERPNQNTVDFSTGSFTTFEYSARRSKYSQAVATLSADSPWSEYIEDFENKGTRISSAGQSDYQDPIFYSTRPRSCTLKERTPTSSGFEPPPKRFYTSAEHHVGETHVEPGLPQNDLAVAYRDVLEHGVDVGSLLRARSRCDSDLAGAETTRTPAVRFNVEGTLLPPVSSHSSQIYELIAPKDLPRLPPMVPGSSDDAGHSRESTDQDLARINYRFASSSLESSLLQRMEERERVQIDEAHGENRVPCHVVSPEDLIWGSVKNYCGMVLDRETRALLGTAVLFVPPDTRRSGSSALQKSAWVTCVGVVEGRTEVLIKNSKGGIHVAQLMLTSTALGLALYSVHSWQGTFALAFLSRVAGPSGLPHRLFVDVDRNDRVYVIGYEEPWESESKTVSDVRIRPGRINDAGRYAIVEIDFTSGLLGGSISSPAGFRGGLVVRADGLLAGLVTGEILGSHPTDIDFSYAYNIYSLLSEL
ncbi:uncharacterized protein [Physcomitrium patens]|uniref:Uncharacterized protein n=1 Tax=Physcomitrium patens TaxID=3218 RepID=A0A7I4FDX1_PHYPA|nr:uncharacterized protein LOC112274042 isoform X2 [Physcomitrium patens]|eukprot:XP_024358953.1 uncharacterized protein LOC112274042 isoform X2 [Physcomitrella patens]